MISDITEDLTSRENEVQKKAEAYRLVRNILVNQFGFVVSSVSALVVSPYVVQSLGDELYGIWSLIVSFSGHYGLLSFGIQGALTRYIAYAVAKNDRDKISGYLNTALFVLLAVAVLSLLAGSIVAWFFPTIFDLKPQRVTEAQVVCLLIAMTSAATFAFTAFQCVLVGSQRFGITNAIGIASTILRSIMTFWLLRKGYGIISLAIMGLGLTFIGGISHSVIVRIMWPWIKISLKEFNRSYLKEFVAYGINSFTTSIAVTLVYQCDLIVISLYLSPENITSYSLAATIIFYLIQFTSATASIFGPYATERYTKGDVEGLREFFLHGSRIMYMLGGLMVAGCVVYGKAFFTLWVGPNYVHSATILVILVIPQFFATGARIGSSVFVGMAKMGPMAVGALCEGISNLILSLILVQRFGNIGVALGTFIPLAISNGLWFPLYCSQVMGVKFRIFLFRSIFPGLLIFGIGSVVSYSITVLFPPNTWSIFSIEVFLTIALCFLMFSFCSKDELIKLKCCLKST